MCNWIGVQNIKAKTFAGLKKERKNYKRPLLSQLVFNFKGKNTLCVLSFLLGAFIADLELLDLAFETFYQFGERRFRKRF
jgi:hypothetical protein